MSAHILIGNSLGYATTNLGGEYCAHRIVNSHWLRWAHPDAQNHSRRANHYGRVPISEFLVLKNANLEGHQPGQSDVVLVQDYLYRMGLLAELALYVMELAGYEHLGRLSEPHDPFTHRTVRNRVDTLPIAGEC